MAAVSTDWFTKPRRGLIPPLGDAPVTRSCGSTSSWGGRVVAVTDLSPSATNAAWRAALVARDLGLPLQLLGVSPGATDRGAAQLLLDELLCELRDRLQITAQAGLLHACGLPGIADAARGAALLVVDAMHGSRLSKWLLGSLAQRLASRCRAPVLAVRRPAVASYRRVTVCVDLGPAARGLIVAARSLTRHHRMQVLHVLQARDQARTLLAGVPTEVVQCRRERETAAARQKLQRLIDQGGRWHSGAVPVTRFGHVPTAVLEQERRSQAQLLVLGQSSRGALMDLVLGGVARWVLPATQADVLLVPLPPGTEATRTDALPRARSS